MFHEDHDRVQMTSIAGKHQSCVASALQESHDGHMSNREIETKLIAGD